ncbi:MAG: hypothetical protein HYV09_27435 [Deltaproteobacteria bacterium]|nr:hypothetical protein [Deltaproteobacteria bacterium]
MRVRVAMLMFFGVLAAASPAGASPAFPDAVRARLGLSYAPPCAICHEGGRGGAGTVTTRFGRAMMDRGLKGGDGASLAAALDAMARDGVDSDHDGASDVDELRRGKDPNGASGVAIGAPPIEYGCGGATVARATGGGGGWLAALLLAAHFTRRRRRSGTGRGSGRARAAAIVALGAATLVAACNPYEVSYVAPEVCQSGRLWTGGDSESADMNPGMACIQCHSRGEGPTFTLAGTLYAASDEKDRCAGSNAAVVYVQGADGRTQKLVPNGMGNFSSKLSVAMPYTAWVQSADGKVRRMADPQSNGDCNACHTQHGLNGAPGRVVLP